MPSRGWQSTLRLLARMHRAPALCCTSRRDRGTASDRRCLRFSPPPAMRRSSLRLPAARTLPAPARLRLPVALTRRSRYWFCLAPPPLPQGRLTARPLHLHGSGIVFGWNPLSSPSAATWYCLRTPSGHSSLLCSCSSLLLAIAALASTWGRHWNESEEKLSEAKVACGGG